MFLVSLLLLHFLLFQIVGVYWRMVRFSTHLRWKWSSYSFCNRLNHLLNLIFIIRVTCHPTQHDNNWLKLQSLFTQRSVTPEHLHQGDETRYCIETLLNFNFFFICLIFFSTFRAHVHFNIKQNLVPPSSSSPA